MIIGLGHMKMPNVFNRIIDVSSKLDALALFFARLLSGSLQKPCEGLPLPVKMQTELKVQTFEVPCAKGRHK